MEKIRFNKLGIEIENKSEANFDIRESRGCIRIFYDGKKVTTLLPDSKIEIWEFGHIICYKGRIVTFGDVFVEAWGGRVFAKNKTRVVAYQNTEVRAGGRTKVRALDSSRVIAGGRAEVFLDGESLGYKWPRSRAKMNVLDNRVKVFNLN